MLKILVVEDNAFARYGQHLYLESLGYQVYEANTVQSAWETAMSVQPQFAVISLILPLTCSEISTPSSTELHGLSLTVLLKKSYPSMGIVLLSNQPEHEREVRHLLKQHQRSIAFLLKEGDMGRLNVALQEVMAGRTLFEPAGINKHALATAVKTYFSVNEIAWIEQVAAELSHLSPREQEIAHLLSASLSSEHIAQHLGLSKGNVDNTISRIYHRLGLNEMKIEEASLNRLPILVKACLVYNIQNSI